MFNQLQKKFSKIFKTVRGHGKISDQNIKDTIREIRRALLEADVNYQVVKKFIEAVKIKSYGKNVFSSITPGQQFIKIIYDELVNILSYNKNHDIDIKQYKKHKILLAGLQGVGKTTTVVKLAYYLKKKFNKNPLIIAADTQRFAAQDQLKILSDKAQVDLFDYDDSDPFKIVDAGYKYFNDSSHDVLIVDTAGRLHIDNNLMDEISSIEKNIDANEVLYVADSMVGQDAVKSAFEFNQKLNINGIILTKLDGDSRGGAAISIIDIVKKPIKYIGVGEKIEDIENFNSDKMANRILGMGDVVSIVEKAKEIFDKEESEKMHKKILNNDFNLNDFLIQINSFKKMGSISSLVNMIPGANNINTNSAEQQFKIFESILNSMTVKEKNNPEILDGSRRKRIAKGSGRTLQNVNFLIKQFNQIKSSIQIMNKSGKMKFKGINF